MLRILNNVVATFVYRKNIHEIFETFVISMTDITRFHLEFSLAKKKKSFSVSMCNVNNQAETRSSFPRALESQHVPDRERESAPCSSSSSSYRANKEAYNRADEGGPNTNSFKRSC